MGYTENKTSDRTCGTDGTCGSICGTCGSEGGAYAGRNYRVVGAPRQIYTRRRRSGFWNRG